MIFMDAHFFGEAIEELFGLVLPVGVRFSRGVHLQDIFKLGDGFLQQFGLEGVKIRFDWRLEVFDHFTCQFVDDFVLFDMTLHLGQVIFDEIFVFSLILLPALSEWLS